MSFRQILSEKPAITVGVTLVILGLAGWLALGGSKGPVIKQAYYYDLQDSRLFADDIGRVPPFTTAQGHTTVRAAVFSCSDCADASSRFTAYLEQYSEAYRNAMNNPEAFTAEVAEKGQLVRAPDGGEWFSIVSKEGRQILAAVRERCGTAQPKSCQP